jgi:hypothetical protein
MDNFDFYKYGINTCEKIKEKYYMFINTEFSDSKYLLKNIDLKNCCNLYNHFIEIGIYEGRLGF